MHCHQLIPLPTLHYITAIIIFIFSTTHNSHGKIDDQFLECSSRPYNCGGNIKNIKYPFWGDNRSVYCGHPSFELQCHDDNYATIDIASDTFRVLQINQTMHTISLARLDLWNGPCGIMSFKNTSFYYPIQNFTKSTSFYYPIQNFTQPVQDLFIFYNCDLLSEVPTNFTCNRDGLGEMKGFYTDDSFSRNQPVVSSCNESIEVPIFRKNMDALLKKSMTVQEALNEGFQVMYRAWDGDCSNCVESGGVCGFDQNQFACLCRDRPYLLTCGKQGNTLNRGRKVVIAGAASIITLLLLACLIIYKIRKSLRHTSLAFWKGKRKNDIDVEAFIVQYGSMVPRRYTYSEVRKITKSFKEKLGQGGYGSVYKGMLPEGRIVAVKVLNINKGNGEEFINEVASIGRTSHVNVVTLLGFCYEGEKRSLIYEFMPNGSLEKFIYCDRLLENENLLGWEKMSHIALGIARGLEYLHRGCNTRILHLDIKPHNILLDEDFCPKISDFGLAKLYSNKKESIVSMSIARGTIGYIAPEVFSRNFGGVSHKSDVYSYGMMLLEMVGGRKNVNAVGGHTSEVYFPDWIYNRLETGEDLQLPGLVTEEENEIARKMLKVSLWCIQTIPSARPSIKRVLEMLEGSAEVSQVPPQPLFPPSPISPPDSSWLSEYSMSA